ncbi:MAG TPA: hypothetical protein VF938_03205, partial [Candidatus Angelobacter sp.]
MTIPAAAAFSAPDDSEKIDVQELVRQAVINFNAREALPRNYTYVETLTDRDPRLQGGHGSDTYEVMEIRGQAFRRHVLHNNERVAEQENPEQDEAYRAKWLEVEHKVLEEQIKPGQTKEGLAAAVQKIMEEAGLKDWKPQLFAPAQVSSMGVVTFAQTLHQFKLPLADLHQKFHLKAEGTQVLDGRMAYVVQAGPKRTKDEADPAGNFQIKVWIDLKERQIVRVEGKAVRAGPITRADYAAFSSKVLSKKEIEERQKRLAESRLFYGEGTTILQEWTKVNDEAWLLRHRHVKGDHILGENGYWGLARTRYSSS